MHAPTSRILGLCALLVLPAAAEARGPEPSRDGPTFTPAEMMRGITMSARDCAQYRSTVFVEAEGKGLCFRYYLSSAGGEGQKAVIFLSGDKSGENLAFDPAKIAGNAELMSKEYRMPAIYLARMGIDGSSGSHSFRRTWLEVKATDLAITAIKARHRFTSVHVMGQSGGAHLTGSLVGIREDIGCAVPGSGRLAFTKEYAALQARRPPERRHYDPASALDAVVKHSAKTRILVVTDPGDERVPAASQTGFVRRVKRAGGRISQFYVTATDELSHGAAPYTRRVMRSCLLDESDEEIGAVLTRMSDRRFSSQLPKRPTEARPETRPEPRPEARPVPRPENRPAPRSAAAPPRPDEPDRGEVGDERAGDRSFD